MKHLEIEYKTLLTKDEYQALLAEFSSENSHLQTNYYIDTPDLAMKKNRFSLRIRTLEDQAELTLKIPQTVGNLEHNQYFELEEIQPILANFSLPDGMIAGLLKDKDIPLEDLQIWGHLTTERIEMKTAIGLLALDKNDYNQQTDYELEIEVTDAEQGKRDFERYLKAHHITFKYASSKVARTASSLKSAKSN